MPLVSMTTNLKSLRFGNDTVGGGNSNQPYIVTPIPEKFSDIGRTGGPDFLLRGGTLLPKVTVQDTSRLFKMFFDFRSPAGPLFVVKQNVLSLSNVNSSAGYVPFVTKTASTSGNFIQRTASQISTFIKNNVAINQGIYTPLSTLGQAAGNSLGVHLNKQGINPFKGTTKGSVDGNTPLGLPTYLNTIATGGTNGNKSRLFALIEKIDTNNGGNQVLYTYTGGPGAILGVGKTSISMIGDQRTGVNNANFNYWVEKQSTTATIVGKNKIFVGKDGFTYAPYGLSFVSPQLSYKFLPPLEAFQLFRDDYINSSSPSVYKSGTLLETNISKLSSGVDKQVPIQVFTQEQIQNSQPSSISGKGFKESFTKKVAPSGSDYIPNTLDYVTQNIETRVNIGGSSKLGPGARGNLTSYVIGKLPVSSSAGNTTANVKTNSGYTNAADQITAFPLYQTTSLPPKETNDLVKFRIGVIDNDTPTKKTYIHFRAFIDSFSDQYTSDWDSKKFMGRGENFYKYNGFDRQISLSWTVAAQSKQELIPMYQKLNYLASVCAPSYSDAGYMRGNLISLTVGGYCYEQVGIMKGITLDVPQESPWEIGISDGSIKGTNFQNLSSDASVKELPMIIKVSGFTFIPIHNFVPQVQQNQYSGVGATSVFDPATNKEIINGRFISNYGKEQYISLAAAGVNNYDGGDGNLNYIP
jgi:hypothetical protein